MKSTRHWLLASVLIAGSMTANATSLLGQWTGTGQPVPAEGDISLVLDLYFLTQMPDGSALDFTGTVNITCLNSPDPECGSGGNLAFAGSIAANDAVTIDANGAVFNGMVSVDQNRLTGFAANADGSGADWTLNRVTPVPVPASGLLFGAGLMGLLVMRRSSTLGQRSPA